MMIMKTRNYEQVTDKSIIDVKRYLLKHSHGYYQQDIHDIMNRSIDVSILKKKLNKRADIQLWLFSEIKKTIDQCVSYDEMEEHLIMMNLLINQYYQPLLEYKYRLFYYILDGSDLSLEIYCLLRHLIDYRKTNLEQFIKSIAVYQFYGEDEFHHLASEIYLLEQKYKQAYRHLPYVSFDHSLQRFERALYNYSPLQFEKLLFKQPLLLLH